MILDTAHEFILFIYYLFIFFFLMDRPSGAWEANVFLGISAQSRESDKENKDESDPSG